MEIHQHENPTTAGIDRLSPAQRPTVRHAGYQTWSDLLFVHWRLPAAAIRPLIPAELELDCWQGEAWIGLVPFHMSGVRPWWSPAVPGVSEFHETNVRTYVHQQGRKPGVWFFSLEAANRLAVWIARRYWNLNYQHATMAIERSGQTIRYRSVRRGPDTPGVGCDVAVEIGAPLAGRSAEGQIGGHATPGTLEHFLAERYYLYVRSPRGRLLRGQVHHTPYPLRQARLLEYRESLLQAVGIRPEQPPCHLLYSPGVDVQVYSLVPSDV